MAIQFKRVEEQTLVITGASSGIGLATALEAARRGARLVLVTWVNNAGVALAARTRQS